MTKEQDFFLSALKNYLSSTENTSIGNIDYDQVVAYAKSHQLQGILYYQFRKSKDSLISDKCKQAYFSAISSFTNRVSLLRTIDKKFSENQIPYILFKGTEIATYYPIPSLRTMGDCDILVREDDKGKARQTLLSIGFIDNTTEWKDAEWHFSKNGLDFELHHRLFYVEVVNSEKSMKFGDTVWSHARRVSSESSKYVLDDDYHFVYLLLHLKKHLLYEGAGFRQFMDVAIFSKKASLDMDIVKKMLEENDLQRFYLVCMEICNRWFFDKYNEQIFDNAFYERATEKIFANGVFGFDDSSNKGNNILNVVKKRGRLKTILSSIFPSYKVLCRVKYYSFVKGRPYLLPLAWVYRLFRAVKYGKVASAEKLAVDIMNSPDAIKEREETLKAWGLM